MEVATARMLEVVKRMSSEEKRGAMEQIESLDTLVMTMKKTIGEAASESGILPIAAVVAAISEDKVEVY